MATRCNTTTWTRAKGSELRLAFAPLRTGVWACALVVLQACSSGDVVAPNTSLGNVPPETARPELPALTTVLTDTVVPGGTVVIVGQRLPTSLQAARVSLGAVSLPVRAISSTRIEAVLPLDAFPCSAALAMPLRVSVHEAVLDTTIIVRTATLVTLAPGQTAMLHTAAASRCVELSAPITATASGKTTAGAQYLIAMVNAGGDGSHSAQTAPTAELRGAGTGSAAHTVSSLAQSASIIAAAAVRAPVAGAVPLTALPGYAGNEQLADDRHAALLATQWESVQGGGSVRGAWAAAPKRLAAARSAAAVGDIMSMNALYGSCLTGHSVKARVVYAGARALVLEDVAAPRAGQMDASYRLLGQEFDQTVLPMLQAQVGNPLALNQQLAGDGRVTLLFTRYVNDSLPGTAGYVSACNMYPRTTFGASNQDEVVYARVASAFETPDEWRRAMRSTVVHETKHLASFAERLANDVPFEEPWMEEATARVAEELYARTFPGGGAWKGRTGFATSVGCELLQCDDRPLVMWKHFSGLHSYLKGMDLLPVGQGTGASANAGYASGWALVRWALDRYADNESALLKALVRGQGRTGLAALAQLTGQSGADLLTSWALSTGLEATGLEAIGAASGVSRSQYSTATWQLDDIMAGMASTYPGAFAREPLAMRRGSFGHFVLPRVSLAGVANFTLLHGDSAAGQLLELRQGASPGTTNTAHVSPVSLAIVRVQ